MNDAHDFASDRLSLRARLYLWLAGFFVTSLIIANIIGSKFFYFGDVFTIGSWTLRIEHSIGMLPFPITFLLTDLLNEYYGKRGARRVTYLGLALSAYAFGLIWLARAVPEAPPGRTFVDEGMFDTVLGTSGVMIIASLAAYTVGQLCDIAVFGLIKRLTGGRMLWLRATGSTVVSQFLDSLTISFVLLYFAPLASGEQASFGFALETAAKGYALKFVIAIAMTPLIYLGHGLLSRVFGLTPVAADART